MLKVKWLARTLGMLLPSIALLGVVAVAANTTVAPQSVPIQPAFESCDISGCHYYLAPWEWHVEKDGFSYWRCPDGDCVGLVDLRSLPQIRLQGGTPQGYGFFVYPSSRIYSGSVYLGVDLEKPITLAEKSLYESAFASKYDWPIRIDSTTVIGLLAELLTDESDPTGEKFVKTLRSEEIHLGGHSVVWQGDRLSNNTWHQKWLDSYQEDYKHLRNNSLTGLSPPEHYKRVLTAWSETYGIPPEDFVPSSLPFEGNLPHYTTITESFNTADSDTLGPDLTWAEVAGDCDIVSNEAKGVTSCRARAESDLSTDDHYAEIEFDNWTNDNSSRAGPAVRYNATGDGNHYVGSQVARTNGAWDIWKYVSGYTNLGSGPQTSSLGMIIQIEASGSSITLRVDDVDRDTITDSSITGNLRTGFHLLDVQAAEMDFFEASDVAVAADRRTFIVTDGKLVTPEELSWTIEWVRPKKVEVG